VVESLDSALAHIDPMDLAWLIGGIVFAVFMLAVLVALVRDRRRIERHGSTKQRPTILKTSPPLAPLEPSQRRRQPENEDGHKPVARLGRG
jgi:hypothetical protein